MLQSERLKAFCEPGLSFRDHPRDAPRPQMAYLATPAPHTLAPEQTSGVCDWGWLGKWDAADVSGFKHTLPGRYTLYPMDLPTTDLN